MTNLQSNFTANISQIKIFQNTRPCELEKAINSFAEYKNITIIQTQIDQFNPYESITTKPKQQSLTGSKNP